MSRKSDDKKNGSAVPCEVSGNDRLTRPGSPWGSANNTLPFRIFRLLGRLEEGQRSLNSKVTALDSKVASQEAAIAEIQQVLRFLKWVVPILAAVGIALAKYL